jgi:hypothetical protein
VIKPRHKTKARKAGRVAVVVRRLTAADYARIHNWPDPPMVPSVALRRVEQAETIEEVRAIVHQFLRPRE